MKSAAEIRTNNIDSFFNYLWGDISLSDDLVVDSRAYLSNDKYSGVYEIKENKSICARVYYKKQNLIDEEIKAREKIELINNTKCLKYKYYASNDYSVDIIPSTIPLPSKIDYYELKNTYVNQMHNLLKLMHNNNILLRNLSIHSFGIETDSKAISIIDYSNTILLPGKNVTAKDTEKHASHNDIFASSAAMQGIFNRNTDYCSLGLIIATLYLGKEPNLEEKALHRRIDLGENAPGDLKILLNILLSDTDADFSKVVDDWLKLSSDVFSKSYQSIDENTAVSFEFLGKKYNTCLKTAIALSEHWNDAWNTIDAVPIFLNNKMKQDHARRINEIKNRDNKDLYIAKVLYILAEGSNYLFWKKAFSSTNELLDSNMLVDMIKSGYLQWVLIQQGKSPDEVLEMNNAMSITDLNESVGVLLTKYILTDKTNKPPQPFKTFYSYCSHNTNIRLNSFEYYTLLAQMAYYKEFDNVYNILKENEKNYYETSFINFYRILEHCCGSENEKKYVRNRFMKELYSDHLKARREAYSFKEYDKQCNITHDIINKMGSDNMPNDNMSINDIVLNCSKYKPFVDAFEKKRNKISRISAEYGLFDHSDSMLIPNTYSAAYEDESKKTIEKKLNAMADDYYSISAVITKRILINALLLAIGVILMLPTIKLYLLSLPDELPIRKSLITIIFLILCSLTTFVGTTYGIIHIFRLLRINNKVRIKESLIRDDFIPNIDKTISRLKYIDPNTIIPPDNDLFIEKQSLSAQADLAYSSMHSVYSSIAFVIYILALLQNVILFCGNIAYRSVELSNNLWPLSYLPEAVKISAFLFLLLIHIIGAIIIGNVFTRDEYFEKILNIKFSLLIFDIVFIVNAFMLSIVPYLCIAFDYIVILAVIIIGIIIIYAISSDSEKK